MCWTRAALLGVLLGLATTTEAAAQGAWEIEAHGGLAVGRRSTGGAVTVPPPGPGVPTSSPIFPTREVPSWFLGDGADLLNAVNEDFGNAGRIVPAEAAFEQFGIAQRPGVSGGFRARRHLSTEYALELAFDLFTGAGRQDDAFLAALDETRESFGTAFRDLLASGPLANVAAGADLSTTSGSERQIALTVGLVQSFDRGASFTPYLTGGGGLTVGVSTMPGVVLEGDYRFDILGEVPIAESDRLVIELDNRTVWVGVIGGGVRRDMSETWGVTVDGRLFIGPNPVRARVSSLPSVETGTPADFIETGTTPSIQFSNNPSTGRRSSLGGDGLQDFELFRGDGIQTRISVTLGVFVRF